MKLLEKLVEWLLPRQDESSPLHKFQKNLAAKFSTLPRRWLIVLFFITFASLGSGWRAAYNDLRHSIWPPSQTPAVSNPNPNPAAPNPASAPAATTPPVTTGQSQPVGSNIQGAAGNLKKMEWWAFAWRNIFFLLTLLYWLVLSILISLVITTTVDRAKSDLRDELLLKTRSDSERLELVARILRHSGISSIYDAVPRKAVKEQASAQQIINAVAKAKSLRMMTIAGYEYIGKGRDSLLFETISKTNGLKIEVILLDPTGGVDVVKERVRTLKVHDSGYNEEALKGEIDFTRKKLIDLKRTGFDVGLWFCKKHPVFRVLIVDDSAFISAYGDAHGHETSVFRIERDAGADTVSWYDPFCRLFANCKSDSEPQQL